MATMQDKQAWSGRFNEPVAELVKRYTASVDFDKRLALFDIQGSLAHAQMLASCDIINRAGSERHTARPGADRERSHQRRFRMAARPGRRPSEYRKAPDHCWSAMRANACTPDVRAMTRWRPTSACICAAPSTISSLLLKGLQTALLDLAQHHTHTIMPGFHASASGAAGELCASPDGLFRDVPARCGTFQRCAPPRQPPAAGCGRAGRNQLSDQARNGGRTAGLRGGVPELAGCRVRPRFRHRIHCRSPR